MWPSTDSDVDTDEVAPGGRIWPLVLGDSWGAGWGVVISFEPYEAQSLKKS